MKVRVGMIVSYKTTEADQARMAEHRTVCNVKAELPAVVVNVDEDVNGDEVVNLKVLLDGQGEIWVKDAAQGDEAGQWDFYQSEEDDLIRDYAIAVNSWIDAKEELKDLIKDLETAKNELKEELADVLPKIEEAKARAIKFASVKEPDLTSGDDPKV